MAYTRPTGNRNDKKQFTPGNHEATITRARLKKTKSGDKDMIVLTLQGNEEEIGYFNLVFDTEFTQTNLDYILGSIEDNGVEIPDLDFDYSEETVDFLKDKAVYISVKAGEYQGKPQSEIKTFLLQEEFEGDEDDEEEDEWDDE